MYIVQANTTGRGWFASANIRGHYGTFAEAEAAIISFGNHGSRYRIVHVLAEFEYTEPVKAHWVVKEVKTNV